MQYKGYTAEIEYDEEDGIFHGRVANIIDVIVFEGKSGEELKESFQAAVDEYLEDCQEIGKKPSSSHFVLSITPEDHQKISIAATKAGMNLNQWATQILLQHALST
ncbi:MAG: type II toxin-antitoxin system HicB family antitoxin [bacterium]